jgi:hypothetical protein
MNSERLSLMAAADRCGEGQSGTQTFAYTSRQVR